MEEIQPKGFTRRLKNKKTIIALIAVVLAGGGYWYWKSAAKTQAETRYVLEPASKQTIVVSLSGTGQIAALDQVDIKPQTSGQITSVKVQAGQSVKAGDAIAALDQKSAANSVTQARASLLQAQASYDKLMAGSTSNDVAQSQLSLKSAQQALDTAKKNYDYTVADQKQAVDKAHSNLLNGDLEAEASDTNSTATISLSGNYTGTEEGQYTISLYQGGGGIYYSVSGLGSGSGPLTRGLSVPIGSGLYITFSASGTVNTSTTWIINVPNKKSGSYLNNLNSYNSAVQDQQKAIDSANNSIASAQNNLDQAQLNLNTKLEPPTDADIASAKAQITSAQAQLDTALEAYRNTTVTAPFDGIIASLTAKKGDQASSGSALATLITSQQVAQISLNEVDAAKVKTGQKATLTFDAIDGLTLAGHVAEIDTIGTATQGVVNYTVKIALDSQDDRVKPGMSVNASVITDAKTDVLAVPSSAIKTAGGTSYVEIIDGQESSSAAATSTQTQPGVTSPTAPRRQTVETGISNDTLTEITSGLNEGDNVVVQTITPTAAKTATNSAGNSSLRIPGVTTGSAGGNFRAGGGNAVFIR